MSRNFRIFVFAALVFATAGFMNDATALYVLAGVCIAVILIAFLLSQLALARLRLWMRPPVAKAVAGAPITVTLGVSSVGGITISSAAVELAAENLTVEGVGDVARVLLPPMPPASELDFGLELRPATRGRYRLGPPLLIDTDPIGMFERRAEQGAPAELLVFPRAYDLPRVATWQRDLGRATGRGPRARRDHGEFRGIREHTPGDDLRHVHWKVTAHVGELAVKEYEPLRHDVMSIHLDMAASNHYGGGAQSTLETAVSAAASIARAGLAEQRSVAVVGDGLPVDVTRTGAGQPHLQRIMIALAEARPTQRTSFSEALARQLRSVPRGASVFIITTAAEESLIPVITGNVGSGGSVTLLVVEGRVLDADERFFTAPRRVREAVQAAGIGVGVVHRPEDIAEALTIVGARGGRAVGVF